MRGIKCSVHFRRDVKWEEKLEVSKAFSRILGMGVMSFYWSGLSMCVVLTASLVFRTRPWNVETVMKVELPLALHWSLRGFHRCLDLPPIYVTLTIHTYWCHVSDLFTRWSHDCEWNHVTPGLLYLWFQGGVHFGGKCQYGGKRTFPSCRHKHLPAWSLRSNTGKGFSPGLLLRNDTRNEERVEWQSRDLLSLSTPQGLYLPTPLLTWELYALRPLQGEFQCQRGFKQVTRRTRYAVNNQLYSQGLLQKPPCPLLWDECVLRASI